MRFVSLEGLTSYEAARELQLKLVELRAADQIPDTILFLEHEPVITRGRGLQWTGTPRPRHMPAPALLPQGMAFAESERGGDLTYHGPGQLVIYPVVKMDGKGFAPHHDVAGFLRELEKLLIEEFRSWGFEPEARENATGVWINGKKIASIGIAIRKWVTYHGVAINCVNDLKPFHLISPCGFSPDVMARLVDLLAEKNGGKPMAGWDGQGWRVALENRLARRFLARAKAGAAPGGDASQPETVDELEVRIDRMDCEDALERATKRLMARAPGSEGVVPGLASQPVSPRGPAEWIAATAVFDQPRPIF